MARSTSTQMDTYVKSIFIEAKGQERLTQTCLFLAKQQICANILGDGWSPVLSVASICISLQSMLASCTVRARFIPRRRAFPLTRAFRVCRRKSGTFAILINPFHLNPVAVYDWEHKLTLFLCSNAWFDSHADHKGTIDMSPRRLRTRNE